MFDYSSKTKTLAYLLLGISVLISLLHVWYPITISPRDLSQRTGVPVMIAILAAFVVYGYGWARVTIGVLYLFLAIINFLIVLAYVSTLSLNQLAQIIPLTLLLGATGFLLLKWKGIRVFEETRAKQKLANL